MILNCISISESLMNYQYFFTIGRKGESASIVLEFENKDFYHLLGLQYLSDISQLKGDRGLIFEKIKNGAIPEDKIEKSVHFHKIKDSRIMPFFLFKDFLENENTFFKFNKISFTYNTFTKIKYDYLMECTLGSDTVYIFLAEKGNGAFQVVSFFLKTEVDYTQGNTFWTILKKEKKNLLTGDTETLFKNPNFIEDLMTDNQSDEAS